MGLKSGLSDGILLVMGELTTEEWQKRLGEQVRAVRVAARLSQEELAQQADVSPTSIRTLEQGGGSSLKTLIAVARVLRRTEWLNDFDPRSGEGLSPMERLRMARSQSPRPQRVRKPKG